MFCMIKEKDAITCMRLLQTVVEKKGIFCFLYTDRARRFSVAKKAREDVSKDNLSQTGTAR
ncbi:MAG: hypothetical protein NC828_00240 [Candidatus Omnitrophica bacterium]|nr:hypothetical protein [Candidatus Omnitrophota bacterium]